MISCTAISACATAFASPRRVQVVASMSNALIPVFSLIMLMILPFGPMTRATLSSGILMVTEDTASFSTFGSSAFAATAAALTEALAGLAPALAFAVGASITGAIPGMYWVPPGAFAAACFSNFSCSCLASRRSLDLCIFLDKPVAIPQSPPVPSSNSKGWTSCSFFSGSSSTGFAAALAPGLAAGLDAGLAAGLDAGFAFGTSAGAAAFGSAFGAAAAFPLAFGCAAFSG
mmetsp:Transcript_110754/g.207580  ORF Transcript_110754/g.207580 Transcript_110754/m.207580 type:complete len:231 (-) Transcript_110754:229-921(-)